MNEMRLEMVQFEQLKGIHNATVCFDAPMTAVMGVNGSGKTTVIHALACVFKPPQQSRGEDYKFPYFFTPNTDATWAGSKFTAYFSRSGKDKLISRTYQKKDDRWSPRYSSRPERSIYYIGINSCVPTIELTSTLSAIRYSTRDEEDGASTKAIGDAAYILNKPYAALLEHSVNFRKRMLGVRCKGGLRYSSLSMGAGEQRTIKMLRTIRTAEKGSLILIDEIDLLLHPCAVKRLIKKLYSLACEKNLQIVFSTHSPLMTEMTEYVKIQYLHNASGEEKTFVFKDINSDLVSDLTGTAVRPIRVYVEDSFSEAIIKSIARDLDARRKIEVTVFGSIENGYSIAAAKVIENEDLSHTLIVTDGDKDRTDEEKLKRINKHLTGNEEGADAKRKRALSCFAQYALPAGASPEEFMHRCLAHSSEQGNEFVIEASRIQAVSDSHQWIQEIAYSMGLSVPETASEIIPLIKDQDEWRSYIAPIREWLENQITQV